jgi:hypothetical protein
LSGFEPGNLVEDIESGSGLVMPVMKDKTHLPRHAQMAVTGIWDGLREGGTQYLEGSREGISIREFSMGGMGGGGHHVSS